MRRLMALGLAMCVLGGCRELKEPKGGYVVVENILSPVRIRAIDLSGAGIIEALMPDSSAWESFFFEPAGGFVFEEPLPLNAWHCDPSNGSEGCVAQIRVRDDEGFLATGRLEGSIYVCTETYTQKVGRKHCGKRMFRASSSTHEEKVDPQHHIELSPNRTQAVHPDEYPSQNALYRWDGDPMSRLYAGDWSFPSANSHSPVQSDGTVTSRWSEVPYRPGELPAVSPSSIAVSADIGACSIFLPHEWRNNLGDFFSQKIGEVTGNLGFAELIIEGILEDPPAPTYQVKDNVMLWADAASFVEVRTDVSPEAQFRVKDGQRQFCLKTYFRAGTSLLAGVEDWYRWDQGFFSALNSLFGIGECRAHPVSLFYCGAIRVERGQGRFEIDESDVLGSMEGYSIFKPSCRNQFQPKVEQALKEGAKTAGQQNLSEGIDRLVRALQDSVDGILGIEGFQVRRLELTPSGIYVITAESTLDPQYDFRIGNCIGDLSTPKLDPTTQPALVLEYESRGITRPIP